MPTRLETFILLLLSLNKKHIWSSCHHASMPPPPKKKRMHSFYLHNKKPVLHGSREIQKFCKFQFFAYLIYHYTTIKSWYWHLLIIWTCSVHKFTTCFQTYCSVSEDEIQYRKLTIILEMGISFETEYFFTYMRFFK